MAKKANVFQAVTVLTQIRNDIPMPSPKKRSKNKSPYKRDPNSYFRRYPFHLMKQGECIVLNNARAYQYAINSACRYAKAFKTIKFVSKKLDDKVWAIWRYK